MSRHSNTLEFVNCLKKTTPLILQKLFGVDQEKSMDFPYG